MLSRPLISLVLSFLPALRPVSAKYELDLSGRGWTLSNPTLNLSVPAQIPSQAHLDLYANQVIGNPYYGNNNYNLRWVVWQNWTYTSPILDNLHSNVSSTWLLFNGLDTFTSIEFCGHHVASTDNQFRQYWFDVSTLLAECQSVDAILSIDFGSAPTIADSIAAEPGQETWPPTVQGTFQFNNRWFIRKEQSDFGWDWGPAFAPAGPWQPAWVVQLGNDEIHVRNSLVDIYREGQLNLLPPDQNQQWAVNASLDYFGHLPNGIQFNYKLTTLDNQTTISNGVLSNVNITDATVTGSTTIAKHAVDLWWPTQMGPQNLYYLTLDLVTANNRTLATVVKRIGFRTIVLNETPISQQQLDQGIAPGNNWHFEINGQEFYAKGSNFVPPDAFWPRVTEDVIAELFESVIDGNQNMLRVWASGVYSPDFMYDLADEMGILLWSEFEFGDALYPVAEDFLENVRQEVEYNVRRVNHHPSLALWAGGNELENLELQEVQSTAPSEYDRYLAEYEKLFLDTLVPIVFGNSRSISYTPSSTSNGWLSLNFSNPEPITERYNNLTNGSIYGETDYYNYSAAVLGNDAAYPVGRFANEFGFHSMSSIQEWREQISAADLQFNSSTIVQRNQHYPPGNLNITDHTNSLRGMGEMTNAVELWYTVPNKTNSVANFSAWCHATQIFQADLYTSEIAFYRRGSGLPNRQLGSLYWQLNEIWAAPTWAGIEQNGRWKVVHYAAKDIYEHVIIAPYYNAATGNLSVWVTSDLWSPIQGKVTLTWYDWKGHELSGLNTTARQTLDVHVGAINSTQVMQTFTQAILGNNSLNNSILRLQVSAQGSLPNTHREQTQTFSHENWFHPGALRTANLVDPSLTLRYQNSSRTFAVTATKGVAAWVWLDVPDDSDTIVHFERNAFWLAVNETATVGYKLVKDRTHGKWIESVSATSMWNQTLRS